MSSTYSSSLFGVDTPLTSVTASPTPFTSVTTPAPSQQFQQSYSAVQTTMSVTTVTTTAAPTSAGSPVPSSVTPSASATTSSSSSSSPSSLTTATSSNVDPPTTSTPQSSVQSTSSSTTPASTTTHSSGSASSFISISTSNVGMPISSMPISTTPSTSNTPLTTTSPPSPSTPLPQNSPLGTNMPLTTVLESTTIYVTSTNDQGQVVTSAPPVITEVITTTGSGGVATTVTQAIVNPTLASDDSTTDQSPFFSDTGAVVGVFVVVGLACAAIAMWILFAIRRRQRMRRIEQDTVIEAAVAAAGFNRTPLDDDEADSPTLPNTHRLLSGMEQRTALLGMGGLGSLATPARLSDPPDDFARDRSNSHPGGPIDRGGNSHPDGYVPARTTSPLPRSGQFTDDLGSSHGRKSSYGHTPTYSAGSFEPLLANYAQNMSDQDPVAAEPPPNRSQPAGGGSGPNRYSSDGSPRNESGTSLKRQHSSDSSVLRDEDDYASYVLMVRNVPDNISQHST